MLKEEIRNIKSTDKELRQFGLAVGGVLALIGAVLLFFGRNSYPYPLAAGLVLAILGQILPRVLFPLQKAWMTLGVIMGFFMTRVILCILFFLVITPIGFISRLAGKKFLDLRVEKAQKSYWSKRALAPEKRGYERQF